MRPPPGATGPPVGRLRLVRRYARAHGPGNEGGENRYGGEAGGGPSEDGEEPCT